MRGYLSKGLDEMRGKGILTRRNNKYKGKGEPRVFKEKQGG